MLSVDVMEHKVFSLVVAAVAIAVPSMASVAAAGELSATDGQAAAGGLWQGAPVLWTAHSGNPVLSAGPPGSWDENIRERMWVIHDAGRFHGWYGGWKGKYNKNTLNLVHLGYATSEDGIHWTKYPRNPVFSERWVEDVCVVKSGDTYYLYGEDETENKTVIHLLTSTDGVKWTPRGNVLEKTADSDWEGGWVGTPLAWREPKQWYMLYEGGPPGDIGLATSPDGIRWHKSRENPVLTNAAKGAWDDAVVGPSSILNRNGRYYLLYIGGGPQFRDGLAVSTDLVHWTRYPRNPIIGDMSAVIVDTADRHLLYCRQNPSGSATNLHVSPK
jgi:beta-1,2-mannobiose phosphorylase / 1,2-beta-oligomannan phosphorylase